MKPKKFSRLPSHIKPERYELILKPDLEGFVFDGEETIFLNIAKSVKEITLHTKELEILSAGMTSTNPSLKSRGMAAAKITHDEKDETTTFKFVKNLPKGKGELKIKFKGILNDKLRGFYRSQYMHEGKVKHMATTQFEATDARRAFPCFDEPAQKAIFDVTLMVPQHLTVISNTLESEVIYHPLPNPPPSSYAKALADKKGEGVVQEHVGGFKSVKFEPSPKMSTYLLAFIVGDFEFIEGKTKDGVVVRIFVTPGKKHQVKFALDCAIKCLEFYNKYFDIPYPLPILDLIAIPDFSSAAMENWGAITYRETALLVDPENTSASNRQWVAIVIAHEIAHQWFGNLVTMHWWTDLWLNEGFAAYMENFVTDKLYPEFDIMSQFVSGRFEGALKLDGLKNTHPIEVEVHHPSEISEIFDNISYAKGSAVIRMLAEFLGEKDFRDGLRYYLKKHAYGNTITNDLWSAFEKVSKKPVKAMMQNWTKEPGYPLIKITQGDKEIKINQARFFSSPISKKDVKDATVWQTPFSYVTDKNKTVKKDFLDQKSKTLAFPKGAKWLKFNAGEIGFFRTDYPAQMLAALHVPIKNKTLSATDRLGIIRDAFSLAESGDLPTTHALDLLTAYKDETDYSVWTEIAGGLGELKNLLYGQSYYPLFLRFAEAIFAKIASQSGFVKQKNEKHTTGLLRTLALSQHGSYGGESTLKHFQKIFSQYLKDGKKINADLRGVAYNLNLQNGGQKEFDFMVSEYKKETMHEEQDRIGRSLGSFSDVKILKKVLSFALSKDVRAQDSPSMGMFVGRNPAGKELEWQFTQKNWKLLSKRYGSSFHLLEWFILPLAKFHSMEKAKEVEQFFKKNPAPGSTRTIQQILENIRSNAAWIERDGKHIEKWLKSL